MAALIDVSATIASTAVFGAIAGARARWTGHVLYGSGDIWVWAGLGGIAALLAFDGVISTPGMGVALPCAMVCAVTDLRTGFIYDLVVASAAVLLIATGVTCANVLKEALGALACGGIMAMLYVATRRRGLGLGDVKLAAIVGAGVGVADGFIALGCAFVFGAVAACIGITGARCRLGSSLRFAPYIALGAVAAAIARAR